MDVYWLEQTEADVPQEDDWLRESEVVCLKGFRFAKRRADWRLGRWTAKLAVASYLKLLIYPVMLARIEIRPESSGAPEVFVLGESAPLTISLSHSAGRALCAVAAPSARLGCDLETIEARSRAFIADYFTAEEIALVAEAPAPDQARLATLLWSAKESALKVLREGLRLDTRSVIVTPDVVLGGNKGWSPLSVRYMNGNIFCGWCRNSDHMVGTLVSDVPLDCPTQLAIPAYSSDNASKFA